MQTLGDRDYVNIPGERVHELPPLLLKDSRPEKSLHDILTIDLVNLESIADIFTHRFYFIEIVKNNSCSAQIS